MVHASIIVRADWDDEAKVWVASSTEIDGLSLEAETLERLRDKIAGAVADLIELNGLAAELGFGADVPIHIMAEQTMRVPLTRD